MAYRSFEDLEVWKRACRLAVLVELLGRQNRIEIARDALSEAM